MCFSLDSLSVSTEPGARCAIPFYNVAKVNNSGIWHSSLLFIFISHAYVPCGESKWSVPRYTLHIRCWDNRAPLLHVIKYGFNMKSICCEHRNKKQNCGYRHRISFWAGSESAIRNVLLIEDIFISDEKSIYNKVAITQNIEKRSPNNFDWWEKNIASCSIAHSHLL